MEKFEVIFERAAKRKGGAEILEAKIQEHNFQRDVSTLGDDRILSDFSKRIFQAGFNWSVVEKKWDGFERAFHRFELARNAFMSDEDLDAHLQNKEIIRNAIKILAIRDNAIFLSDLARDHGSAAKCIGLWPASDQIGLMELMKKNGSRLGGNTGQYALRFLGKDCFILSRDVVTALKAAGVVDGSVTSKSALRKVQDAFNAWHDETGYSYTYMSRVLALSQGE